MNPAIVLFLITMIVLILSMFFIEIKSPEMIDQKYFTIRMMGYSKAAISFVKYLPQVYLNWKR